MATENTRILIDDVTGGVLIFSVVMLLAYIVYNFIQKEKKVSHYLYIGLSFALFVWVLSLIGMKYTDINDLNRMYIFDSTSYIGATMAPVFVLLIGIVYTRNITRLNWKYLLLFVVPLITILIVWTNPLHNLYYTKFGVFPEEIQFGPYMYINGVYSYGCMIAALTIMIRFAIKSTKYFITQIVLFCIGNSIPMVVSLMATLQIFNLSIAATPLSFVATIIFHGIAIFRFQFLNLTPIALRTVMDRINDCYAIVNDRLVVVDFNKPMVDTLSSIYTIKGNIGLAEMFTKKPAGEGFDSEKILNTLIKAKQKKGAINYKESFKIDGRQRYFYLEITPIFIKGVHLGSIVLIRDITKAKEDIERLRQNQAMLMERERLASLGQLIGGIAHNLKTPIMSISGSVLALEELIKEYKDSVADKDVTPEDHYEIAEEMGSWVGKIRPYCSYMSEVITAVKDQAVQMNVSIEREFTVEELIKRVELLINNELKRHHCTLVVENKLSGIALLRGDINNLVQVLDNFIINARDAYDGNGGIITLSLEKEDKKLIFGIHDKGKGIPKEIQPKLFKEMITTKGVEGTGLGLYLSHVAIKGKFGGDIWFRTKKNEGTSFFISIPVYHDRSSQKI
ncbi:MAG: histidine kinase N-terminal 7TM domain-containing protein [Bacillota bacterium]|nr:histidine kinase N-terminal 7TM domain-containing protein [Bacillota bacterium]